MLFRVAQKKDYKAFCYLMSQVHYSHQIGAPEFYKKEMSHFPEEDFIQEIGQENIYVLEVNDEIIGFSFHNIIDITNNPAIIDQRFMYIIDICIEEKIKNQGYGTIIFNALKDIAKNKKCNTIKLDVYNFNKEAISFYKKMKLEQEKIGMTINIQNV